MFKKILIANRGEIACRIIRTVRQMGIATVAVYSESDYNSLHVQMADEAVLIGPSPASESYLIAENILAACQTTGADAVHPGYGFLSENAKFAQLLETNRITFIGPNKGAIEAMGDKIAAKKIAQKAGVSVLLGTFEAVKDAENAARIAEEIGYPVIIKASAGGGGKGMRIARNHEEVLHGFERACSEAASAFGDSRVFVEKFIDKPRHIEIQILADKHGHVIHLNERECSIQRRHQKIIEEAPSAFVDHKMRTEMGRQACLLASAVGYDSAGTVEFVVTQDREFYFLEMNTRLQVEHPVTEFITGIDLIEHMIKIAAGQPLKLKQEDIHINGWALESRICAEDPSRNFLPSIGRLKRFQLPNQSDDVGDNCRVDTGVYEGSEISVFYDSLLAKLITHGSDRDTAIQSMVNALNEFVVEGVETNLSFLNAVMNHPRLKQGKLSTEFIAEEYPDGFNGEITDKKLLIPLACAALSCELFCRNRLAHFNLSSKQLKSSIKLNWVISLNDYILKAQVFEFSSGLLGTMTVNFLGSDHNHQISWNWHPSNAIWQGVIDSAPYTIQIKSQNNKRILSLCGINVQAHVFPSDLQVLYDLMPIKTEIDTSKFLTCPMPGLVLSIPVKNGQNVKTGEVLAVIEAMKMENVLRTERDIVIKNINVEVGDSLNVDEKIMEFDV